MWRVAIEASDIAARVGRFGEMRLLVCFAVAAQTASASLLPRLPLKHEYFGFVAAARHVVGSGPMATFATLLRGTALHVQCGLPVRRFRPSVINFLVTRLAGLGSHVLGSFGRRRSGRRCAGGLGVLTSSLLAHLAGGKSERDEKTQRGEQKNSTGFVTKFLAHRFESLSFMSFSRARRPPVTSLIFLEIAEILMCVTIPRLFTIAHLSKNQTEIPVWCKLVSAVD